MLCGDQHIVWTAFLSTDWLAGAAKAEDEAAALEQHLAPIGRLSKSSPVFRLLVEALVAFDNTRRAKFLDLVCSNPRLPPGGLPQAGIKVASQTRRGARVWAQTCVRTLYLPDYATAEALREGLDEVLPPAPFPWCAPPPASLTLLALGRPSPTRRTEASTRRTSRSRAQRCRPRRCRKS